MHICIKLFGYGILFDKTHIQSISHTNDKKLQISNVGAKRITLASVSMIGSDIMNTIKNNAKHLGNMDIGTAFLTFVFPIFLITCTSETIIVGTFAYFLYKKYKSGTKIKKNKLEPCMK